MIMSRLGKYSNAKYNTIYVAATLNLLGEIMVSWWDLVYLIYAPWDTDKPPRELVELVEGRHVESCNERILYEN